MLDLLKSSLESSSTVKRKKYFYFQHPLTDLSPSIDPNMLREICDAVRKIADLDVERILTMEAAGIHVAALLSHDTDIPLNVVRKTPRYLLGEVVLDQSTGYSKGKMYLNIEEGKKVFIVDTVISTGRTMIAVINGLKMRKCEIKDIVCVIERGNGKKMVKEKTGFDVKTLVRIDVSEKVKIIDLPFY